MIIYFAQVYIDADAQFTFSHLFQRYLSQVVSSNTQRSAKYDQLFGPKYELMFRISAKTKIKETEVMGPKVFKKAQDVEYFVFLPFDRIKSQDEPNIVAVQYLLRGVCKILELLDIDTKLIREKEAEILAKVRTDPTMLRSDTDEWMQ